MSSSSICTHFTQNAWKKDLCSNCFKSKDEHKTGNNNNNNNNHNNNSNKLRFTTLNTKTITTTTTTTTKANDNTNKKTDYPNKHKMPVKSIIKKALSSSVKPLTAGNKHKSQHKVSFPKHVSEVIGYGGEWSDDSYADDDNDEDDDDFMNLCNERVDEHAAHSTDDEETLELKRITRANTDFNMNNGNLLGDAQENIKRSFAALKLGAPQMDKEGKKQTLKINVVPFGSNITTTEVVNVKQTTTTTTATNMASSVKAKFETKNNDNKQDAKKVTTNMTTTTTTTKNNDGKNSPPVERAMEKSLLDEISETLEQQQKQLDAKQTIVEKSKESTTKIKFEIKSLSDDLNDINNKPFLELKKSILRNTPITKEHAKPKVNVFHKYNNTNSNNASDSDSNGSEENAENGISAYYDVVEAQLSYENLPDGKCVLPQDKTIKQQQQQAQQEQQIGTKDIVESGKSQDKSIFSSSQYITDMLLSSRTRAASYNLHEGNFMTSKITADGLIVTKCNNAASDDAIDSTGSSFDGSSDEETSYNMTRSESDSGIGISIGSHDYKNIPATDKQRQVIDKKLSASNNNSDYEDIQVNDQRPILLKHAAKTTATTTTTGFNLEKSRELHGEPDGSADPDGAVTILENKQQQQQQLPALPKSPPPTKLIDARPSFLHGLQKQQPPMLLKKPDLPAKPVVTPNSSALKTITVKRQTANEQQQQVISQLQMMMSKSNDSNNNNNNNSNNHSENEPAESAATTTTAAAASASVSVKDDSKLKKGKAPNPPSPSANEQRAEQLLNSAPPTPERDYSIVEDFIAAEQQQQQQQSQKSSPSVAKLEVKLTLPTAHAEHTKKSDSIKANEAVKLNQDIKTSTTTTTATSATLVTAAASVNENLKSTTIKENKEKQRIAINPKFRSLNTFVTQRQNATKNLQLQQTTTDVARNLKQTFALEANSRETSGNKNLSMSEEYLADLNKREVPNMSPVATMGSSSNLHNIDYKKSATAAKAKTKFSIKKFLRMGTSKTTDNLHKKSEGIYSEICTGEEHGVVGKPRLVIIHPIDINTTAVEVVKDITKTNDTVNAQTVAVVTAKPPAPPLRATEGQRAHELNKPARPPPPKSAELQRKQHQTVIHTRDAAKEITIPVQGNENFGNGNGSIKSKSDNVYANLGEIRSSIAPRKPERTASMREREAQLELARKRHVGTRLENTDTLSICSSNGDNVTADQLNQQQSMNPNGSNYNAIKNMGRSTPTSLTVSDGKPPTGSRNGTFERRKAGETKASIASKLEIFEQRGQNNTDTGSTHSSYNSNSNESRPPSLKDSVRKITSTIDSYLKDKRDYENMYDFVKTSSPPPPPARLLDLSSAQRVIPRRSNIYSDSASVSSFTRSEYVPNRNFGLNNSIANIPRVISASYCGSEVGEFDIYSPYSYYGSEVGAGDLAADINDSVWGIPSAVKGRGKATNRLRMRKGRSVVHKTIEDNYTAVVVANHEALAQVLDQLQQTPVIPAALRPLANAINLRFEDFSILEGGQAFVVGKKAFHAAMWTTAPVTLALSADCNQLSGVGGDLNQLSGGISGVLNPITEFCDLVPSYHLPLMPSTAVTLMQATISVLPRLQLDTLQSIGTILKGKSQVLDRSNFNFRGSIPNLAASNKDGLITAANALRNVVSVQNLSTLNEEATGNSLETTTQNGNTAETNASGEGSSMQQKGMPAFDDVMTREVAFIMLQLVNGMKNLQAKAIEEMPLSLSNVVLSKDVENKDAQARLCVLQGNNNDEDEPMGTLCRCAHIALTEMLPNTKITCILSDILLQERAESLSKSKSVLEFVLWGPSDVVLSGSTKERELALQRWLDLERATVLHGLVRTRIELTVYDECHLMFLVRSNAKMMNDAAKIVYSYQEQLQPSPDT